jgi:hypothetical protein
MTRIPQHLLGRVCKDPEKSQRLAALANKGKHVYASPASTESQQLTISKCSGGLPCEACAARNSACEYDVGSDQRRKIANQRNVHDLAHAQTALERSRQLLGGIISVFRAGSEESIADLIHLLRQPVDLSTMSAHVRNEIRSNPLLEQAFHTIDFQIDGPDDLPSPTQLLNWLEGGSSQGADDSRQHTSSAQNMDPALSNLKPGGSV